MKVLICAIVLLFCFQIPFYVSDFELTYLASKAVVPVLGFCLGFLVLSSSIGSRETKNAEIFVVIYLGVLISVSVLMSMLFHSQAFLGSLMAQAKLLQGLNFFLMLWFLRFWKVAPEKFSKIFIAVAICLTTLYLIAFFFVDAKAWWSLDSYLFINDAKGYRIRFPSFLSVILYFFLLHYVKEKKSLVAAFLLVGVSFFVFVALKQRVEALAIAIVSCFIIFSGRLRSYIVIAGGALALVLIGFYFSLLYNVITSDTSYVARARQIDYIFDIWADYPMLALFGVGRLSSISGNLYQETLGFEFHISDLGWFGLLHEFGLIGVCLILVFVFGLIKAVKRFVSVGLKDDLYLAKSFLSYIYMTLILSLLAPRFLYVSGVFLSIYAISLYCSDYYRANTQR